MLIVKKLLNNISKKRKLHLFSLMILNLINSFCEVFTISLIVPYLSLLTKSDFDNRFANILLNLFPYSNIEEIITIVFIISIVCSLLVRLFYLWISGFLSAKIGAELSIKALNNYLYQPYDFHIEQKSGEIIASINLYAGQTVVVINSLLLIINSLIIGFLILLSVFFINPFSTILGFISVSSVYLIIYFLISKKLFLISKKSVSYSDQMYNSLQEGIGSIREIKLNNSYKYFVEKYSRIVRILRIMQANARFLSVFPKFIIESIAIVFIVLLGYFLFKNSNGNFSFITTIGFIVFAIQKLLPYLQQIYNSWATLKTNVGAINKVLNMIEMPVITFKEANLKNKYIFKKNIIFEDVSFRFNNHSPYVLKNINLVIDKGEKIGIIGETGSGKSTLLDLLLGLIKPSSGKILVDGKDINDIENVDFLNSWRNALSAVSQNIFLRDTSIAENIAFTKNKNEELIIGKLVKIAKATYIYDFIKNSRDGFKTLVGERGIKLSGGQLQRIGIARALYKGSKIILLDEATSALDNMTEAKVIQSIYGFDKDITLIMIAHRVSTLEKCERIIELSKGKIKKVSNSKEFFDN